MRPLRVHGLHVQVSRVPFRQATSPDIPELVFQAHRRLDYIDAKAHFLLHSAGCYLLIYSEAQFLDY
jgi:hypothetical protein